MKILIADDEADIRNLIKISLEENGYTVLTAQNGKEALDLLLSEDIHLAISIYNVVAVGRIGYFICAVLKSTLYRPFAVLGYGD
ncbi:hypothetical protein MASR2M70_17680 [Bacillota bacterium]